MCCFKKQDIELLKNKNISNNLSETDIKDSLSFLSFLFALSLNFRSKQDFLIFTNIRNNLQSIRSSDKNLLPKLTNRRIVSQCNPPPSSLLTKVKKFTLHLLKVGAFSGLIYISIFRIKIVPKAGIQPTSSFASIGTSISSNICASSEPLLNEQIEKNNHNTVFVVNPLFELVVNPVNRNLQPVQAVVHAEVRMRQTAVVFRGPEGITGYYRNQQSVKIRLVSVAAHVPRIQYNIPRGLSPASKNTVEKALRVFEREAAAKFPHFEISSPKIKELDGGKIEVSLNGYTSVERYTANQGMNVGIKNFIVKLVSRNPELFKDLVLAVEKSEADHLLTTNFSNVLGMNRNHMATILLHPKDHDTKDFMKDKYRRPVEIEDIVDWIVNINGETKKHFYNMALEGKLTGTFDLDQLNKALDKCAAHDIALYKTTQFYHSQGTAQTSDMLRTLDSAIADIRGVNINLFETGESGNNKLSKNKLGDNMKRFFTTQKAVAAFCYESESNSKSLKGGLPSRVSQKTREFKEQCYIYFTEGSRRLDDQVKNDPEIIGSYLKFQDILDGKGEYTTVTGEEQYQKLLFNGKDPFAASMTSTGRSNTEQRSDRHRDILKVD